MRDRLLTMLPTNDHAPLPPGDQAADDRAAARMWHDVAEQLREQLAAAEQRYDDRERAVLHYQRRVAYWRGRASAAEWWALAAVGLTVLLVLFVLATGLIS